MPTTTRWRSRGWTAHADYPATIDAYLKIMDGWASKPSMVLGALPRTFLVGRDSEHCSVVLDDRDVSRQHLRFERVGPAVYVTNVSDQGTILETPDGGEQRLGLSHFLNAGDKLRLATGTVVELCGEIKPAPTLELPATRTRDPLDTMSEPLTATERLVLAEIGRHADVPSNNALARALYIAEPTLRTHLKNIYRKRMPDGLDNLQKRARLHALAQSECRSDP